MPQGIIQPTNPNLTASFTVTPASPQVMRRQPSTRRPPRTTAPRATTACTYSWDFGDGTSRYRHDRHAQSIAPQGSFAGDADGHRQPRRAIDHEPRRHRSARRPRPAAFTFSPTPASLTQDVFFNAECIASRDRTDDRQLRLGLRGGHDGLGVTTTHRYERSASTVTLTVTDDAGDGNQHVDADGRRSAERQARHGDAASPSAGQRSCQRDVSTPVPAPRS